MNDLSIQIMKYLTDYTDEVNKELEDEIDKISEEGFNMVVEASPVKKGNYKKGWKLKKSKNKRVIYNATHGRATHLLENGHALVNGGRSRTFPHIKPAEKFIVDNLSERVLRRLSK